MPRCCIGYVVYCLLYVYIDVSGSIYKIFIQVLKLFIQVINLYIYIYPRVKAIYPSVKTLYRKIDMFLLHDIIYASRS